MPMLQHVFLSLLMYMFILAVVWLSQWDRFHHGPAHGKGGGRSLLPRRLKPRTPLDCPACCLAASRSSPGIREPNPVRPWREVKSRRGAPTRVQTAGFACPNHACGYYGISDADVHAIVSDGSYGKAERIQRWCCQACGSRFSARLHTPLYRLKTPSHRVALVLGALAEGLDVSAAERVFGMRHATITRWLVRAGTHAQTLHERSFRNLVLPHLQLDELRTRLRSHTQVLWLWVAIDPLTTCIPVWLLGPRTHGMAVLATLIIRSKNQPFGSVWRRS
jgi:transposase-like protein